MKRFFLISALSIISAIIFSIIFDSLMIFILLLALVFLIGIILKIKFKAKNYISLIIFIVISILMFTHTSLYISEREKINSLIGTTQTFEGVIVEQPQDKGGYFTYTVKPEKGSFEDFKFDFKIKLSCSYNIGAEQYDKIQICADIKELNEEMRLNYYADNIMLSGKIRYCALEKVENKPLHYIIKKRIVEAFYSNEKSDLTGIPIAILTGDKSYISNTFYQEVKATGMAHIMAVSGFHISVICMSIVSLIRLLNFGKKPSAVIGLITLFILAGIAGFTGSILRASLMYIIIFLGELISRRPDAINSLGCAITLLCIINPYSIFSISLLLSAMGTFGILVLSPYLTRHLIENIKLRGLLKKIYTFIMNILIISFSAGVFVLPISLYLFGYVSIISVIVNLFITIPVYVLIYSAIIYVICYGIPYFSTSVLYICTFSSNVFKHIISSFASLDFGIFYKDDIMLYIVLFVVLILCSLIFIFKNRILRTVTLSILLVSLTTSLFIHQNINSKTIRLTFVPAKTGSLVIVESKGETALISSTKDWYAISNAYYFMNERLENKVDYLVIASDDVSVLEKNIKLSEKINIDNIALCKNIKGLKINNVDISVFNSGDYYDLLVNMPEETLLIDNSGTGSLKTDYILTSYPILSYKINGNNSSYIIDGNIDSSVYASGYINKNGAKTAILSDFGIITSKKIGNNLLKFQR